MFKLLLLMLLCQVSCLPADQSPHYCPLSDQDRLAIEAVVAAEARGESLQGQMAVAQTIRDRALCWEQSPREIVEAPHQFASGYTGPIPAATETAVRLVFDDGQDALQYPVIYFYDHSTVTPYWVKRCHLVGVIGGHTFMRGGG